MNASRPNSELPEIRTGLWPGFSTSFLFYLYAKHHAEIHGRRFEPYNPPAGMERTKDSKPKSTAGRWQTATPTLPL
jgi:hypothetical protein